MDSLAHPSVTLTLPSVTLTLPSVALTLAGAFLLAAVQLAPSSSVAPVLPRDTLPADFGLDPPTNLFVEGVTPPAFDAPTFALGRALFFDPVLSGDRTVSCASCHQPEHGFADPRPLSIGVRGQTTLLHSPSLLNRGLGTHFSWTGGVARLHDQVLLPIHNSREMDLGYEALAPRLRADPRFGPEFESVFGRPATIADTGRALTAFVERIWIGASAVDRFQSGDVAALDDRERAGLWIYESKAGCWRCHAGRNYTDEDFHATGIGAVDGIALAGRASVTDDAADRGRFKTPTLRGLTFTAPYMHDGSIDTLEDVVAYYRRGGNSMIEKDAHVTPLDLTDAEASDLVAFLRALSR